MAVSHGAGATHRILTQRLSLSVRACDSAPRAGASVQPGHQAPDLGPARLPDGTGNDRHKTTYSSILLALAACRPAFPPASMSLFERRTAQPLQKLERRD